MQYDSWPQDVYINVGDYIYPSSPNGFLYVATNSGKTQSTTIGKSALSEPAWHINTTIYDGILVWDFVVLTSQQVSDNIQEWRPGHKYNVGEFVVPTYEFLWNTDPCGFVLSRIVAEPAWVTSPHVKITDNEVVWESLISAYFYIPKGIVNEPLMSEIYKTVDYLSQMEYIKLDMNEVSEKFGDRLKLEIDTIYQVIDEMGYDYLSRVLNLTKEEVDSFVKYIGLMHLLKGQRSGLELVMSLMGLAFHIEEWWETPDINNPTIPVQSFNLDINVNISQMYSNTTSRLTNFIKNYVYPKLNKLVLSYLVNFATLATGFAGVQDTERYCSIQQSFISAYTLAGIQDIDYPGSISYTGPAWTDFMYVKDTLGNSVVDLDQDGNTINIYEDTL